MIRQKSLINPLLFHSEYINTSLPVKVDYSRIPSIIVGFILPIALIMFLIFVLKVKYDRKNKTTDLTTTKDMPDLTEMEVEMEMEMLENKIWNDINDI